ncbi:MAG: LPS export ABC transporter ATP-binding protein [Gammaproteobacteria bacterium]|nr:LPS export ABC transporter ATP-binding protein [Gammaproteobacteria bacterium]
MSELQARDLRKTYRGRTVLDGVSLSMHSREVVGLLGPNGAGKTTCFYMIVGLVDADAGHVLLNDADITALPMHARARLGIGYLPQEPSVFRKLTVAQNLLAILETRRALDRSERTAMCESLMEEFQIAHLRDSLGINLSGGERRRVEIARALATEPQFILLDEPFAGVDPLSVLEIQRMIQQLTVRGIGVLITDHNVRETLGICGRAYILTGGKVMAEGEPQAIVANPTVKEVYLGADFTL